MARKRGTSSSPRNPSKAKKTLPLTVEQRLRDSYIRGEGVLLKAPEVAHLFRGYGGIREAATSADEKGPVSFPPAPATVDGEESTASEEA